VRLPGLTENGPLPPNGKIIAVGHRYTHTYMPRKQISKQSSAVRLRLSLEDVSRVDRYSPVWVRCSRCSHLAHVTPSWGEAKGECKCVACGAVYTVPFFVPQGVEHTRKEFQRRYSDLPLWLKADFRGGVFWALNGEHLDFLERVIRSTLRERPVMNGRRLSFTMRMPFNLPSWILSAKNRPDLLKLIARLRSTIP
jgi:hypothetical protein